jgi:hypothetical protein
MNKYLEKIAANMSEKDKHKPVGVGSRLALGYLGAAAGMGVGGYAVPLLSKDIIHKMDNEHGISDHGTVRKFMRDNGMGKHNTTLNHRSHISKKLPWEIRDHHRNSDSPSEYTHPATGEHVVAGMRNKQNGKLRNMDVAMHELGHAKDFSTHVKIKNHLQRFGNTKGAAMGLVGVAAMGNEHTRHYAPLAAALPGAAILRAEGMANYHAYKGIKAHKGAKAANKFLTHTVSKQMLPYAAAAAVVPAGLHAANKIIDYVNKKHGIHKEASMSDKKMAEEFHEDEKHDVKKYEDAKKTATNPKLLKAINYALPEEKIHARLFGEALKDEEKK